MSADREDRGGGDAWARPHEVDDLGLLDPAWSGIRRRTVTSDGVGVRVLEAGPARPPGRTPVVLLHGLGGSATNWVEVQPALAADRRVLAVDLPGFGETPPARPSAPRPGTAAGLVARLLPQLTDGPVVLVGNSMGGLVATLVAGEHPALVAGLGLLAPALPQAGGPPRVSAAAVRTFAPFVVARLGSAVRRRRQATLTPAQRHRAVLDVAVHDTGAVPRRVLRLGEAGAERADQLPWRGESFTAATSGLLDLVARGGRPRALAAIDAVGVPTLVVRGEHDLLVHANVVRTLRRRRPTWEAVELPGIGHVPQLEAPGRTVELLRTLFARVDDRTGTW